MLNSIDNQIKTFFIVVLYMIHKITTAPSDTEIQQKLNVINGASAECVMDFFYKNSGWNKIKGEVGRNGIDGLYYKTSFFGFIDDVLIAESKYNTSKLGHGGKNKNIKQMSKEWILKTLNRLSKYLDNYKYTSIKNMVEDDQYRARLFTLKPIFNNKISIVVYKIKNKGLKTFDTLLEQKFNPIDIGNPSNNFEVSIVNSYNQCRKKYLEKYLDFLDDNEIENLLNKNMITKKDIV